jgi:hypothetical protein
METSLFRKNYILKVWGSTILGAPILMMFLTALFMSKKGYQFDTGAFGFITFSIGYGFLLSIPTFLIIYFLFSQLSRRNLRAFNLKLILLGVGILSILLTFFILYGIKAYNISGNYAALTFSFAYTVCLTFFGLIFPLKA